MSSPYLAHFALDPEITLLNHGSYGACPRRVLEVQSELRARMEAEPVRFFSRELEGRLDEARHALARFLGAAPEGLAFVRNASEGVNTVLARYPLAPGDVVLTTDHAYAACKNALDEVAARAGASVRVARVPFPIAGPGEVLAAVEAELDDRVRLALLDHVTSPTGLVLPIPELVRRLAARGVDSLVDGAHAPGMLPLELDALGAAYYTGNCHKWLCAPKGAAFLWVREDKRATTRPLVISHGAKQKREGRSRFRLEFDWTGTDDPTAVLSVPAAIELMASIFPGGWPAIMAHNRALAIEARALLIEAIGGRPLAPELMLGSLATIELPDARPEDAPGKWVFDPLGDRLFFEAKLEVPVFPWPAPPRRMLRIAAQIYNDRRDYERLAEALRGALTSR